MYEIFHRYEIAERENYSEMDIHVRRVISGGVDRWVKDGSSPPAPSAPKCIATLKSNREKGIFGILKLYFFIFVFMPPSVYFKADIC